MGDVKDILGISQPKDGVSIPIKMGLKSSSSKITSPPDFDKRKKRPSIYIYYFNLMNLFNI